MQDWVGPDRRGMGKRRRVGVGGEGLWGGGGGGHCRLGAHQTGVYRGDGLSSGSSCLPLVINPLKSIRVRSLFTGLFDCLFVCLLACLFVFWLLSLASRPGVSTHGSRRLALSNRKRGREKGEGGGGEKTRGEGEKEKE